MRYSEKEFRPRNAHTAMIFTANRISGCADQKELSNNDQLDNCKEMLGEIWTGPAKFEVIQTIAKGERLDRPELAEIEAAYASGIYDFAIFDDLSRLLRGGDAVRLLGLGVDNGTRTICIADGIDTNDPTWEEDALNGCSENVAHVERTSKRIKQKSMNRFKKFGSPTGRPIAGYIVPKGAKSYDQWLKNESLTQMIKEGAVRLRATLDCCIVADYFNSVGFPVGPYARRQDWNGKMVRQFFGNSLLKGFPQRGTRHTVKHHGTGRRVSKPNPKGPIYYAAPHLAHLPVEEFDELNALLDAANAGHGRPKVNGVDPLAGRSRNYSAFPGMHSVCWYCGHYHVWGANGTTANLMCNNAREWHCWHSIGYDGPAAVEKIVSLLSAELSQIEQFDEQFRTMVAAATRDYDGNVADQWRALERDEAQLGKQRQNLLDAIKTVGADAFLKQTLDGLKATQSELLLRRHRLEQHRAQQIVLPESPAVLRDMFAQELSGLAMDSPECALLLRKVVPAIHVYAVRLCDGGHLYPRARVTLDLAGTLPNLNLAPEMHQLFGKVVTIDLFEPPQRERIRAEAVALAAKGLGPKAIAAAIGERPTSTAVHNALALQRTMDSLDLTSPYVVVLDPPDDYPKLRRHKHPRYQFRAREGYVRPQL